ncbi:AAA family ATPase [Methanobacterium formicicum]|uniref:AAA family ATPase n=1 Tax=Methanobacterium formicicum TaxID=2162 RepID=UPI002412685E|nr:AAA family ATPase [Methanobacterium formicicum]MDG3548143.1 AAA family ATPase [Methanobacterium formicicum]
MKKYYESNMEYVQEELKRIDLLINLQVIRFRQNQKVADEFQGIYIADEEIDCLLNPDNPDLIKEDPSIPILKGHIIRLESEIAEKEMESLQKGIELRLPSLANLYNLKPFEIDCILICLAPSLDRKYEKMYAYLNDDVTKKYPTVDLVLNLLCNSAPDKVEARKYFEASEPLFKQDLIHYIGEEPLNLLSRPIKLDNRIINYIMGIDSVDSNIEPYVKSAEIQTDLDELILPDKLKKEVNNIIGEYSGGKSAQSSVKCLIQGNYGVGKKTITQAICNKLDIPLLEFDITSLMYEETDFKNIIPLIFREAQLKNSAIYLEHLESLFSEEKKKASTNIIFELLEDYDGIVFMGSEKPLEVERNIFKIDLPVPDYPERRKLWEAKLDGKFSQEEIDSVANKFRFTPGQINDTFTRANKLALMGEVGEVALDDVYNSCKVQSNQKLVTLARKIKANYQWDDLILPKEKKEQLIEIKNYIKNRGVVYHDWGFDSKLSMGKGLNISFSGSSGTGKTMAAEVIASELKLDLYKVDLSMVVSKYIGETEKNLNQIFHEAEQSNAILFFDEADALFGKRTEIRDSHDRYANIEISYLLQKMEEYEGIVIMATNLSQNIDEAFLRRMHFSVEFPFPEEQCRHEIWKTLIPQEAPVSDDIDFNFLARNFKLAGGNIKNIIVNAAFYAAEDSRIINMGHIIKGLKREYQKIGKICSQSDFGEYYELIL